VPVDTDQRQALNRGGGENLLLISDFARQRNRDLKVSAIKSNDLGCD